MRYPKIETLYNRDPNTHKIIRGELRRPEFTLVSKWLVTEKIDGTNIRVRFSLGLGGSRKVVFAGRTDNAQLPPFLLTHLQETFTPKIFAAAFPDLEEGEVILFGEGYGARIQKGGGDYREGVGFRLFDVVLQEEGRPLWWLQWKDVEDVARKLSIKTAPVIAGGLSLGMAAEATTGESHVALEERGYSLESVRRREGIVARTDPPLFDRRGERVVWKLKEKDL